jgi:hypothetical protein
LDGLNEFLGSNIGPVAVVVGITAAAALVAAAVALVRVLSVTRSFSWLSGQWDGEPDSLPALLQTVERSAKDISTIREQIERMAEENRGNFKRIGLVRYDAFDGIAGQQSYSLCILDDNKSGYLLSSLVGRDFARSYAVEISNSEAPRKLGDEEAQALHLALKD